MSVLAPPLLDGEALDCMQVLALLRSDLQPCQIQVEKCCAGLVAIVCMSTQLRPPAPNAGKWFVTALLLQEHWHHVARHL